MLFSAAKSMYSLYVELLTPDTKSTPKKLLLVHQSQATLPGRIHEVSDSLEGEDNKYVSSEAAMSTSLSDITAIRHGKD